MRAWWWAREPVGEVEHDAREEARLGNTQQETHDGETVRADTSAVMPAKMPQVIMMRAIHMRAPTFSMTMLLGTSKMK